MKKVFSNKHEIYAYRALNFVKLIKVIEKINKNSSLTINDKKRNQVIKKIKTNKGLLLGEN